MITGERDAEHDQVPYVWSDQFGRALQFAGVRSAGDRLLWRGDPATESWTACWLDDAYRLRALLAVGRPRDLVGGRRRIGQADVLDPGRPLQDL